MMNRKEHLLTVLMEECAEVQKACSKALRFGLRDIKPGKQFTNSEMIYSEFQEAMAVFEMCHVEGVFPANFPFHNHVLRDIKIRRVEMMMEFSEVQGLLS